MDRKFTTRDRSRGEAGRSRPLAECLGLASPPAPVIAPGLSRALCPVLLRAVAQGDLVQIVDADRSDCCCRADPRPRSERSLLSALPFRRGPPGSSFFFAAECFAGCFGGGPPRAARSFWPCSFLLSRCHPGSVHRAAQWGRAARLGAQRYAAQEHSTASRNGAPLV